MVNYTWVANLLREIEIFADKSNDTGLSVNLALACAALISDAEDKVEIDLDARRWLEGAATRQFEHGGRSGENIVNYPHC